MLEPSDFKSTRRNIAGIALNARTTPGVTKRRQAIERRDGDAAVVAIAYTHIAGATADRVDAVRGGHHYFAGIATRFGIGDGQLVAGFLPFFEASGNADSGSFFTSAPQIADGPRSSADAGAQ